MNANDISACMPIHRIDDDLGPYLFLREHELRRHRHVVRRQFKRAVLASVLPERAVVLQTIRDGECFDVIAQVDDVTVLLRAWSSAGDIWASAATADRATAVVDETHERAPAELEDGRVAVRFTDAATGNRYRKLDVRSWPDIRHLYPADVRGALDRLMAQRPRDTGRLLLWHGAPGTGKTTAIGSLLHSWREWADGTIVTDPEMLLADGGYLRRTVLRSADGGDNRWQLLILEDAESVLRKSASSNSLAKLLNLADGLLGQGLRCLFLITTNEQVTDLHPALLRPGRCMANIEFTALTAHEASSATGQPVRSALTLGELLAAYPIAATASPVAVGQYL